MKKRKFLIGILLILTIGLVGASLYVGLNLQNSEGPEDSSASTSCTDTSPACVGKSNGDDAGCQGGGSAFRCKCVAVASSDPNCSSGTLKVNCSYADSSCGTPTNKCPNGSNYSGGCGQDGCASNQKPLFACDASTENTSKTGCQRSQDCENTVDPCNANSGRANACQCSSSGQCSSGFCNSSNKCATKTSIGGFTCPNPPNASAVICAVYDCPNGDTNGDGECLASDEGSSEAFYTSNCPSSPPSGCGQIDYYTAASGSRPDFGSYCGYSFLSFSACSGGVSDPVCGNGKKEAGEECDDGNNNNNDSCNNNCKTVVQPVCGDGKMDAGETCDDGNKIDGDGCDSNCQISPKCGDGNMDTGETCDDGNNIDGDGCDSTCQIEVDPTCGDGNMDAGETCDDGNNINGDGCDSTCQLEENQCGDSCTTNSECPNNHSCISGTCTLNGCTDSNCVNGCAPVCGGPCTSNLDCPNDHSCDLNTNKCILSECANDPTCINNGCLPKTALFSSDSGILAEENRLLLNGVVLIISALLIYRLKAFSKTAKFISDANIRFTFTGNEDRKRKEFEKKMSRKTSK
ncbi:MAG: DUF4215 domain-containing protein [Candidatus Dojkabacteria bacterium]|nr:DUF4215 domain-containing protein [Candidatus Dojkabacteria bacterium]